MSNVPEMLADVLARIAASTNRPVSAEDCDCSPEYFEALIALLTVFGIVRPAATADGTFEPVSEQASYFLLSSAEYARSSKPILDGWQRNIPMVQSQGGPLNGPILATAMESARLGWPQATPIRRAEIAQVLIKGKFGWGLVDRYLVRWDAKAHSYQLIGGHSRPHDADIEETMWRELEEETPGLLSTRINDGLIKLTESSVNQVSRTYGALTEYKMTFFRASLGTNKPLLTQSERWVTAKELERGKTRKGDPINQVGLAHSMDDLSQTLQDLPLSFRKRLGAPKKLVARQLSIWAGSAIGLIASIASLIQFIAWIGLQVGAQR